VGSIRGKKVDFSLGVSDLAASDDSGDVFGDVPRRGLVPSASLRRVLEEEEKEIARSASRRSASRTTGVFQRRRNSAAGGSVVSHRNRFFGRRSHDEEMGEPRPPMAGQHDLHLKLEPLRSQGEMGSPTAATRAPPSPFHGHSPVSSTATRHAYVSDDVEMKNIDH